MTGQRPAQPTQNPLTLVMKAKSPADLAALRQRVEHIQSLPREQNPVVLALDRIGTVHFARFVFLSSDLLAVITAYDGDFEDYLNDFLNEIGDVFNALLQHVEDAPSLPVQAYRQEFIEFVRAYDLRCVEPFYSAYPDHTVLDILETKNVSG
ncbi:MAG: hypothetical protein ACRDRK_11425 [Pseudonocardia sp.]